MRDYAQSVGGYTCPSCGGYIPTGTTHQCFGTARRQINPPLPFPQSSPGELRIAAALERIAAVLEALTAKDRP